MWGITIGQKGRRRVDRIGGYELHSPWQTTGSGSARWCIAQRDGQRYFMKEFLSPVYPAGDMHPELADKRRKRCEKFEGEKRRLYFALSCVIGDTLVPVLDFFRYQGRCYAVSEEVPKPYVHGDEARISPKEAREMLYALAECLRRLHNQGIIHADIKPEHLLLTGKPGSYQLRLIDLDSGFLMEEPPAEGEDMEGDPVYLAPEVYLRLTGNSTLLSAKLDTFALGILVHRMWTGELPGFERKKYTYAYQAALDGGEFRLSSGLPFAYHFLVQRMLRKDPADRPDDSEIVGMLASSRPEGTFSAVQTKKGIKHEQINGLSRFLKMKNLP